MTECISASFQKFDEICRRRDPRAYAPALSSHNDKVREYAEKTAVLKRKVHNASQGIPGIRNLPAKDQKDLKDFNESLELEQQRWIEGLWSSVSKLRKRNATFAENICLPSLDDDMVKKLVEGLERDLSMFKERQRQLYDEFESQQLQLEDALQHMEQRFDGWVTETYSEKEPKPIVPPVPPEQKCNKSRFEDLKLTKISNAVDAIQAEIDHDGGEYGFWPSEYHDCFQRLYMKHNMSPDKPGTLFYKTAAQLLSDKSHEDVVEHVIWFAKYEERKEMKKKLLAEWRERRNQLTTAQSEEVTQDTLRAELEAKRQKEELQQKKLERKKKEIAEWKLQREQALERKHERQAQEVAERARIEEERFEKKRIRKRSAVQEFVEKRRREKEAMEFKPAPRRAMSVEVRDRIECRNRELFYKKILQLREKQEVPKTPTTPKRYDYVKPRLYDQTEAFMKKMKGCEPMTLEAHKSKSKYTAIPGNWAHQAPGFIHSELKIPAWRRTHA